MSAPTLRELIDDGAAHVLDGAMGTMLYSRGMFLNVCYDELNVRQPDLVRQIHREYVTAGAEILETNTFGANPLKLARYGLADDTERFNAAAVKLAREAADGRALVVGAIGPLGVRIEPFGELGFDEARAAFGRQVDGLLSGAVDGFVLETFGDVEELRAALAAVRDRSDLPVFAQMTIGSDGRTAYGTEPATFGPELEAMGVDVLGLNCSVGPVGMLEAIERLAASTNAVLSAIPNAGLPREIDNRKIYMASPEYMGSYARRLVEGGARFVGGCCGTTPQHTAEMVRFVRSVSPRVVRHAGGPARTGPGDEPATATGNEPVERHDQRTHHVAHEGLVEPVPLAERSAFGAKLAAGRFTTTVEIVPPKGIDPSPMLAQVRALQAAGVDAVDVPDGPRALSRMSAMLSGLLIEREVGLETVVHYTCRDRNLLGMLSDLLGAAASGIRNVLVITGDPPKMGPYPESSGVFDIDSIGLTNLITRLNHGIDPGGNPIGEPTRFVVGVGVNPAAYELDRELRRLAWKVEAGAEFVVTQPVFDLEQFDRFLERAALGIPVIAGIWPLVSLGNAEFLANEMPGVSVPPAVLERMRLASRDGREAALGEGVAIAREMLAVVRTRVAGVQVSAPFGRVPVALDVLAGLGDTIPQEIRPTIGAGS